MNWSLENFKFDIFLFAVQIIVFALISVMLAICLWFAISADSKVGKTKFSFIWVLI